MVRQTLIGLVAVLAVAGSSHAADTFLRDKIPAEYGRRVWTERDGLVFGEILALTQDRDGVLWLGTDAGLVRFDGHLFERWPRNSPHARAINALAPAGDGGLWLGDDTHLSRLHGTRIEPVALDLGKVVTISTARDGRVWAGGAKGLATLDHGTWRQVDGEIGRTTIYLIFEDAAGRLWVNSEIGLYRRDHGSDTFARVSGDFLTSIVDGEGGEIVGANVRHGVHVFGPGTRSIGRFAGERRLRLLRDRRGYIWVASSSTGLWRVWPGRARGAADVPSAFEIPASVSSLGARCLFEDRNGDIWVSVGASLLRLSYGDIWMRGREVGLPDGGVTAVVAEGDRVWAGTTHGLYRLDGRRADRTARLELPGSVTALHLDSRNRLWVSVVAPADGRHQVGTFQSGHFTPVPIPESAFQSPPRSIAVDDDGGIWLCDMIQGLRRWHGGSLQRFEKADNATRLRCASAERDGAGRIWFGLSDGSVATFEAGVFSVQTVDASSAGATVGATTIHVGARTIWAQSPGALRSLSGRASLPVAALLPGAGATPLTPPLVEDTTGSVWVGTHAGLLQIRRPLSPGQRITRLLTESDGLLGQVSDKPYGGPAAALAPDGTLWFATSRGLAMLDPATLQPAEPARHTRVRRALADGVELSMADRVLVPPGTRRVDFEFESLNLGPRVPVLRYRLSDVDTDWRIADDRRTATYRNLPAQDYTLRLQVDDPSRGWIEAESPIAVRVRPHFYATTWFYGLSLIGLLGLVGAAWWLRVASIRKRFASVAAERARVARELHDTLLQRLSSVAVELQVLSDELGGGHTHTSAVVSGLRKRVTECVRDARDSIEQLRASPAASLPDAVRASAIAAVADDRVRIAMHVAGHSRPCDPLVQEQLIRIVQEAVCNARTHGHPDRISIEIEYFDDSLMLSVSDDGAGFDATTCARPGHWGIAMMRERAATIGASFDVLSQPGAGTQIAVAAPLRRIHTEPPVTRNEAYADSHPGR
ncbi:MAG: two-component regulator propeller domain-containing protein [Vicinamibacterales bacterium]